MSGSQSVSVPDTGRGEKLRDRRAQSAGADHERMRRREFLLRLETELGQQDVPAVAKELRVVHRRDSSVGPRSRPVSSTP